ncbi:MAG: MATE family efflux transporter [Rickettsiales bacterium]|jgi:putative MATE family efflux protein|nr:MATE family efflux transporter [Rickettsiales bacterium]
MNKETTRLGTAPVGGLLWRFAMPAIISFMVGAVYNASNRIFIGAALGDTGLAALGIAAPLFLIAITINLLCGVGGNALFSIKLGCGDAPAANKIVRNTIWLQSILGAAYIAATGFFMNDILIACGASAETLPLARQFMTFLLCGVFFDIMGNGLNQFVRSLGRPGRAMANAIAGSVVNIILDYVLIIHMDMGMAGAGIATAVAMFSIFVMVAFSFRKSVVRLAFEMPSPRVMWTICKFGAAPFVLHLAFAANSFVVNGVLAKNGGDVAIGAWAVVIVVQQFLTMPVFGFTQAMQAIAGYNYGAGKFARVRSALMKAFFATEVWLCAAMVAIWVFGGTLASAFGDGASSALAARAISWLAISFPFLGMVFVSGVFMNATGHYMRSLILNFMRAIGFALPAIYIGSYFWGIKGLMVLWPVGDIFSCALAACLMFGLLRRLNRQSADACALV